MTRGRRSFARVPLSPALALLLCAACGSGLRDSRENVGATFTVTRMGAKIDFAEVHLEVPASAVDHDIEITVRRIRSSDGAVLGDAFAMTPENVVFARPLTLSLDLPSPLPVPLERVVLAGFSPPIWRQIPNSEISEGRTVVGDITQLATFAAVLSCGSNGDCTSGSCDTGVCQAAAGQPMSRFH